MSVDAAAAASEAPRAEDGSLLLGGLPSAELAASYGTPLLVIDTTVLDATIARARRAADACGIELAYAGKALLITALARRLAAAGLLLDCCSLGELLTAEAAGYPPERLYLHGCGKSVEELQAAVDGRVGRIVVDGFDELGRLAALSRVERPVSVVLRFNTGIEAHTHEFVRTGGENTKFGFALADADRAFAAVAREPALRCRGVHGHVGSQIVDAAPFLANVEALHALYARGRAAGHDGLTDLIAGGGFGVPTHAGDPAGRIDLAATLAAMAERSAALSRAAGVPAPRLAIEPGRALIAEAGTTLYRVVARKRHGARTFVVVDGGMTDNPRPALYGAYHHPELASRASSAPLERMTLCGRACENDELVEADLPADLRPGDLIALRVTGAYTFSMASNYNRFPRPAVVFAGEERHRLVVRRETADELLRHDVDAA